MVMRSRATNRRSAPLCQGKSPDETFYTPFGQSGMPEPSTPRTWASGQSRKLLPSTPVRGSFGESRLKSICEPLDKVSHSERKLLEGWVELNESRDKS
jgi:hypothetical protein